MARAAQITKEVSLGASPARRSPVREYTALLFFILLLSMMLFALTSGEKAAKVDFISYWAAARATLTHQNPYDPAAVMAIEQSVGYAREQPMIMRNPPFAIPLALPLGLMSPRMGSAFWTFLILAAIALSLHIVREMHGNPENRIHLLGYLFAPTLACLADGQSVAFVFAGVVVSLWLHRSRPVLAGLALSVCAIKPHLLLPFELVLLLWIVAEKRWRVLWGAVGGTLSLLLVAVFPRPSIVQDYVVFLRGGAIEAEFVPTLSVVFRGMINLNWTWLQMVPALLGCGWAVFYYRRNRQAWSWAGRNGWLLLLVSVWVSPYAWPTDEILVLPALLGLVYTYNGQHKIAISVLGVAAALALGEMLSGVQLGSGLYLWTSTAWLVCYLIIMRTSKDATPMNAAVQEAG